MKRSSDSHNKNTAYFSKFNPVQRRYNWLIVIVHICKIINESRTGASENCGDIYLPKQHLFISWYFILSVHDVIILKGADRGHSDFFDVSHINLVFHLKLCNEMIFRSSSSSIRCANIFANDKYNQTKIIYETWLWGGGGVLNNNSNEVPCINLIDYMQHINISFILESKYC